MKFKFIDKLLLVLLLLFTIGLSALCIGVAMNLITEEMLSFVIDIITNGLIGNQLIMGGIGLVLLVIALRLFIAMGSKKERVEPAPTSTLLLAGENGSAYITLAAIDSLVQRHVCANQRIKECSSRVGATERGIGISLRLSVLPETVIPELSAALQASLKENIESICGVTVSNVDILILPPQAPKVPKTI